MSVAANELHLFIDNTSKLRKQKHEILARLAKRKRRGTYDRAAGRRAFKRLANDAAKSYVAHMRLHERWNKAFSDTDRTETADEYERLFRDAYRHGELEWMLPESMQHNHHRAPAKNGGKKKASKKKASKKKASKKRRRRCPIGTEVQTLVFPRSIFSMRQARDWARRHGYRASKIDETEESYRLRQLDPAKFEPGSFRTIHLGHVAAVIGCPLS